MAEDDGVRIREGAAHPGQASARRAGVVDHADANAAGGDDGSLGQDIPQVEAVHVAVNRGDRRPERVDLVEHVAGHEVACMDDEVGRRHPLPALVGQAPCAPRQVRVGEDGDEQRRAQRRGLRPLNALRLMPFVSTRWSTRYAGRVLPWGPMSAESQVSFVVAAFQL